MDRFEAIEKASSYLEEDVTVRFEEAEERASLGGTMFFYVSNSNNHTVRVEVVTSSDGMDTYYVVITEDVFIR